VVQTFFSYKKVLQLSPINPFDAPQGVINKKTYSHLGNQGGQIQTQFGRNVFLGGFLSTKHCFDGNGCRGGTTGSTQIRAVIQVRFVELVS
jgi:hypothetical protein